MIKSASKISTIEYPLSTMEYQLLVQLVEGLSQILAGLLSSLLDKTLQQHCLHVQLYIKVMNSIMLRRLFYYQSLQSLHLIQYFGSDLASNYIFTAVTKNSHPVIDQQHSLPVYPAQASVDTVQCHSLIGVNVQFTCAQPSLKIIPPRLAEASPLPVSNIVSSSCDHNGGILTSKYGDLKLTIPEGAIKDGDLVTLSVASALYGPFVPPSKYQAGVVSPYYWIGVSESYHFQKPVKVEFEHFGACDPSHYQLLCCEDDNESYTMQPVDYELSFKEQDEKDTVLLLQIIFVHTAYIKTAMIP